MLRETKNGLKTTVQQALHGLGIIPVFYGPIAPRFVARDTTVPTARKDIVVSVAPLPTPAAKAKTKTTVFSAAELASNEHRSRGMRIYRITEFADQDEYGEYINTGIKVTFRAPHHKMFSYTEMMGGGLIQGRVKNSRGHYYPDLFRVNQQGNLASLNLLPVIKQGRIVLVRLKRDGSTVSDPDVNEKIYSLCDHDGRDIGTKMWVDHIEDNVVYVRSLLWGEAEYFLRVKVAADGKLHILSYHVKLERDTGDSGLDTGPEGKYKDWATR